MPFRPLREAEHQELEQKIAKVKEQLAGKQQYLAELESSLKEGVWYSTKKQRGSNAG